MEKNLQSTEAIKKLQELIGSVKTGMLITSGKNGKNATRPMAVIDTDASGNLWFYASRYSNKVKDIEEDQQVQIVFAHPGKDTFISVHGRASIETNAQYIKDKWNPIVKTWFPGGVDDPVLCLIKVKTDEAQYWDTNGSKGGTIVKVALSAVTGKKTQAEVHGDLHF